MLRLLLNTENKQIDKTTETTIQITHISWLSSCCCKVVLKHSHLIF